MLEQAESVLAAWNQTNSKLTFSALHQYRLHHAAQGTVRQDQAGRSGVKANYGDDSSQYEMVGGTRLSERKPRTRKAKA